MAAIVEVRDLYKSFTRGTETIEVLMDLNLDVTEGEFLALMGPSGSGKTTLLNLIAGLDSPTAGTIRVGDAELLRSWLVGDAALPESNARLYYGTVLERMEAPGGLAMSAYTKALLAERATTIAVRYEQEAAELLRRTRQQALDLLSHIADAVTDGATPEEVLDRLSDIQKQIVAADPASD